MKSSTNKKLTVLDCTFRDGGYYNNWYFEPKTVKRYLSSMVASGVDIVEIGFRFPAQKNFCGPFAYSTDEFLSSLEIPSSLTIGVMINAKDFIAPSSEALVRKHFAPASQSPVKIVRIAAHFKEIDGSEPIVKTLSSLGYRVGYNLMQSTGKTPGELTAAAKQIHSWGCVEVLYFADSFGNMKPKQILEMTDSLKQGWQTEIGIHTHDNMGLALSNSLEAINTGVSWVDSTVTGMGRGAGNTQTEHLLVELAGLGYNKYNPQALFVLVLEDFAELKNKYGWGPSLLYYLSAAYNIHPTYVQELLSSNNRNSQHTLDSLEYLKTSGLAASYDAKRLARSFAGTTGGGAGKWQAKDLNVKEDVLILGPGPAAKEHRQALEQYVKTHRPIVLATNTVNLVDSNLVTAHVACHHTKLLLDYDKYNALKKPIILPVASVPKIARDAMQDVSIWDYGLMIDEEKPLRIYESYCEIQTNLVAGYAMAVAVAAGAKRVLLAGFDGFGPADDQQLQMQKLFDQFKEHYPQVKFISVTPTTYRVVQGSIYAPGIAP